MSYYFFTVFTVIFFAFLEKKVENKIYKKFFFFLLVLMLILISGCRVDNALYSDEWNYRHSFTNISQLSFQKLDLSLTSEPAFTLLNWILSRFTNDPQIFIFVCSAVINAIFVNFLHKYSKNFIFSIFIYICSGFFFTSMNIIRQYIAMAIIILGFEHLKNKKIIKYTLYVFIAFLFHKSAIMALIFYFILNSTFILKHKIISFIFIVLILLNFNNLLNIFENSFYSDYVNEFSDSGYGVGIIRILFWSIMYLFILWKSEYLQRKFNIDEIFIKTIFLSFSILLISSQYVYVARLDYFQICSIIMIPFMPHIFKQHNRGIINIGMYSIFFLYGLYLAAGTNMSNLIFTFL